MPRRMSVPADSDRCGSRRRSYVGAFLSVRMSARHTTHLDRKDTTAQGSVRTRVTGYMIGRSTKKHEEARRRKETAEEQTERRKEETKTVCRCEERSLVSLPKGLGKEKKKKKERAVCFRKIRSRE